MNKSFLPVWLKDSLFAIIIGVAFFNNWIWRIVNKDILIAFLILILTVLLLLVSLKNNYRTLIVAILIGIFILTSSLILKNGFDNNLNKGTTEELKQMGERHGYLAEGLGKLYRNKFSLVSYKNYSLFFYHLEKNIFDSVDLNLYFFAGHPRERIGIEEFEKFPFFFLPFFIIGLLNVFKKGSVILFTYFILTLAISIFLLPTITFGPILFFPLFSLLIAQGIMLSWRFVKK